MNRLQAAQRADVPPFHVMDLLAAAAERRRVHGDLLDLLAGQPSTGAPQAVNDEAVRLLQSGDPLGYTPATGIRELREADLAFTLGEAAALLAAAGTELEPESLRRLWERTEGWAAGLRLAALTLRDHPDPAAFVAAFAGDDLAMADYLVTEVLARQPGHRLSSFEHSPKVRAVWLQAGGAVDGE